MDTRPKHGLIRRSCRTAVVALALGSCLGALTALTPARAQGTDASASNTTVSLNLQNQPVSTALNLLFKSSGKNFSIDPAVQGFVTININNVSFDVALRSLLRATNPPLTFDVVDNVYQIKVKPPDFGPAATPNGIPQTPVNTTLPEGVQPFRIPIDHYDAYVIAGLIAQASAKGSVVQVPPNIVLGSGSGQGGMGQGGMGQGGFGMGGMGGGMGGMGMGGMGGGMGSMGGMGMGSMGGGMGGMGGGMGGGGFRSGF